MKSATWRRLFAVAFSIIPAALFAAPPSPGFRGPEPVSPGQSGQFRVVADRCPTFSWSAVPGAWGYEVVLYSARAGAEEATLLAETEPVLRAEIPAPASSWTPSLDQCLDPGERYVWFIREKGGFGQGDGAWSRGFAFEIDAEAALGLEALLEPLNQLQAQLEQIRQLGVVAPHDLADDIKSSVSHIRSVVDENLSLTKPVHFRVVQIHPNVLDIQSTLNEVKPVTAELLEIIEENRAHIIPEIRSLLDDAIEEAKSFAAAELEGRDAFLGADGSCLDPSPCFQFRSGLITFVTNVRELYDTLTDPLPSSGKGSVEAHFHRRGDLDFHPLIEVIERLPGRSLYSLYRALVVQSNLLEGTRLEELSQNLEQCLPAFRGLGCSDLVSNEESFSNCSLQLTAGGVTLKVIGKFLDMLGETHLDTKMGVHGYPGIVIKSNRIKKTGALLAGASDALGQISAFITAKLRHCLVLSGQHDILSHLADTNHQAALDEIRANVAALMADLGAVDADVDALGATLLTHDGALSSHHAHLAALGNAIGAADAAHDLRLAAHDQGIVTSVAALDAKLDAVGQDLDLLRSEVDAIQIDAETLQSQGMERQLVRCEPLVSLYLPSSHGGRLEAVMDLVSESISRAASAGVPTKDAEKHFARGQSEFASERYPKAFDEVCKAYRALTSGGGA